MANTTFVFQDRSDPRFDHVYVTRGDALFAMVGTFPNHEERQFYVREDLSDDLKKHLSEWTVREGDVKPPLLPGGSLLSREAIPDGSKDHGDVAFFGFDDNEDVRRWCTELRVAVIADSYRVSELPPWVKENQLVLRYLQRISVP